MSKKYTYEEVKQAVKDLGYELVGEEYINSGEKLFIRDNEGYIYYSNLDNLKAGKNINRFYFSNPYTIHNIKLWIKINNLGYELISNEYKNNTSKLYLKDANGFKYTTDWAHLNLLRTKFLKYYKGNDYTISNINLWLKQNNKDFELISDTYENNSQLLKWKCTKATCNEYFEMCWRDVYSGSGCPYCRGLRVGKSNCFATHCPNLISEWHPTKNGNLTPYDITCGTHKQIWWQCKEGHEWQTTPLTRINGMGCPYCSHFYPTKEYNLLVIRPDLCEEWDYERNDKRPEDYCPTSGKKVWWICKDNPNHKWDMTIAHRNNGRNCPYCSGKRVDNSNCLATKYPNLLKEWDYNKNTISPFDIGYGSGKEVWWKCNKCDQSWKSNIPNRAKGQGCPYCTGRKVYIGNCVATLNPELLSEWCTEKNKKSTLYDFTCGSDKKVWWRCEKCGHEWQSTISNRVQGKGCPSCAESKGETKISEYLSNNNFIKISQEKYDILNDTNKININYYIPQKTFEGLVGLGNGLLSYDFYLPNYNLLIEYQGEFHDGSGNYYTKQNLKKQKEHDKRKKEYAQKNNIKLLEIWYCDFDNVEKILNKELKNIKDKQLLSA